MFNRTQVCFIQQKPIRITFFFFLDLNPAMNISGSAERIFLLNILDFIWYIDSNWLKIDSGEMGYRFIYKKYTSICILLRNFLKF